MRYTLQNNTRIDLSMADRYNITIGYLKDYITSMIELESAENDTLKDVAKNRILDAVEDYIDILFDEIENDKDFIISLMFDDDPYNSSGSAPVGEMEVSEFANLLKKCDSDIDGFDFSLFFASLPQYRKVNYHALPVS